ncbi:MAG: hypothetical protein K0U72_13230 [Gammaproteobacteria bacterium]|nr:hypothetical protein [Gammaproteobacteria bacterium]
MRKMKLILLGVLLVLPALGVAAADIPGAATWYLHVDLHRMKSEQASMGVYDWLSTEVLDGVKEDAGIDLEKEIRRLTAFSLPGQGPVIVVDGDISQDSKDKIMALIMAEGDIKPHKASGKSYYHFSDDDYDADSLSIDSGTVDLQFDLDDEAWISTDIKDKILITASESQMQGLLKNKGRVPGSNGHKGALVVLTAEKTILQAGMNSDVMSNGDSDGGWESNILRNTEQVAFLVAAAADKLAIEAKLTTTDAEMADSLASVVRGLISLLSFSDELEADAAELLRSTRVRADGNSLSISLAVDSDLVVTTLSE